MKKFTIEELSEIQGHLNHYRKVSQVAKIYNVSRTTIYNYFFYNEENEYWDITNEPAREINNLHLELLRLRDRVQYEVVINDKEIINSILKIERAVRHIRKLSVRI